MTRLALVLTVLLLTLTSTAAAKGLGRVHACGADGCTEVTERATYAVLEGGPPTTAPRGREPWFELRVEVSEGEEVLDTFRMRWLPKSGLLRAEDGTWMDPPDVAARELAALVEGLEPKGVAPRRARVSREEDGGGGAGAALAIGAPAVALLGLGALLARRRRRR